MCIIAHVSLQQAVADITRTTRRYTRTGLGDKLAGWLELLEGAPFFVVPQKSRINESLSATEAHIVVEATATFPETARLLREGFAALERDDKCDDQDMLAHYHARAERVFAALPRHPRRIENLFPDQDGRFSGTGFSPDVAARRPPLLLSDAQMQAVLKAALDSRPTVVFRRKVRSFVKRLMRQAGF